MNERNPSFPGPFRDMQHAVAYLERSADYEKVAAVSYDRRNFNLERMELLLDRLGNPHRRFRSIHIAGTKGKGSCAAIIESCLRRSGTRTGLHTSPHLSSICERMRVDGSPPDETRFCTLLGELKPAFDGMRSGDSRLRPTYFELTVAMSFEFFARSGVEWAVVEVGLGGRLDATNVIRPEACLITSIGFDHMDKLGDTAAKIAFEKAGILKPGAPLVLSRQVYPEAAVSVLERASGLGCSVSRVGRDITAENIRPATLQESTDPGWIFDLRGPGWRHDGLCLPLLGQHQVYNAAAAVGVIELLKQGGRLTCPAESIRDGLASCRCPARVEVMQKRPLLLLDTSHTPESAAALADALSTHFPNHRISILFGCSSDKNHEKILEILAGVSDDITLTRSASRRAAPTERLAESARRAGFAGIKEIADPVTALEKLLGGAGAMDAVCVTGSFFIAGEIIDRFTPGHAETAPH